MYLYIYVYLRIWLSSTLLHSRKVQMGIFYKQVSLRLRIACTPHMLFSFSSHKFSAKCKTMKKVESRHSQRQTYPAPINFYLSFGLLQATN